MEAQTIPAPTPQRRQPSRAQSACEIDVEIGQRLRIYRVMAGISQQHLGERVGVTFQQIQKYERAANRVSAGRLVRIAEILGVRPIDLLPDSAQPDGPCDLAPRLEAARAVSAITHPPHRAAVIQLARNLAGAPDTGRGGAQVQTSQTEFQETM